MLQKIATQIKELSSSSSEDAIGTCRGESWIWAILVLSSALLVMFYPVLFGGKTTVVAAAHCRSVMPGGAFGGDHFSATKRQISPDPWAAACQNEAWLKFLGDSIRRDIKIPLWNPYSGCGMPFLANSISQALCPPNIIASLFPSNLSFDLMVLSRLLLAGVFTFFALRLFIPGFAAIVGAVSYMFTGYFLLYLNMPDIFVELLIPALILATEQLIRRPSCVATIVCAGVVALNLLGGLPEVSFLSLVFLGFYVIVRLMTVEGWARRLRLLGLVSLAYFAGLALALPQVLPFLEYLRFSDNAHDPSVSGTLCGLDHDSDWRRGLLSYLFPVGWQHNYFARGFYGVGLSFLAVIGAFSALSRIGKGKPGHFTNVMMLFFLSAFALMLLKRFGSPVVQWIGQLPLFNMVLYTKYDEPLMAVCVAALGSFGVAGIQQSTVKPRFVAGFACALWLIASILNFLPCGPALPYLDNQLNMRNNMLIGMVTLVSCTALCLLSFKIGVVRRALPLLILLPLLFETYTGYIGQAFYGKEGFVQRTFEPYKGAPYIDFLKRRLTGHERVFGLGSVLVPNWSAAFGIQDVRFVDALCPAKFHALIDYFLANPSSPFRGRGFDGAEISTFNRLALQRLCALTSTTFLLSPNAIEEFDDLIVATAHKFNSHDSPEGLCFVPLATIDGVKQAVMFQHPNRDPARNKLNVPLSVPDVCPQLAVDFIRNPDQFCPARHTPVEAVALVRACDESIDPAEFVFVNKDVAKLHATRYEMDLRRFAGKKVILSLTSRASAGNECSWEWVGWKKLSFQDPGRLACIYDREIKIYQLPDALPHAAIFSAAEIVDDELALLGKLATASFSPLSKVLFTRFDLPNSTADQVAKLRQTGVCRSAKFLRYESERVEIDVSPVAESSILLLTDNYFPGWRASIDGKEVSLLRGNLCFRALLLPVGAKTVCFQYDSLPFKLGLLVSGLTLLAFLAALALRLKRGAR
jgi:hypothetical protein